MFSEKLQTDHKMKRKIKKATVKIGNDSLVFDDGEVYLYRTDKRTDELNYYEVEDESDKKCPEIPIAQLNTVVTNGYLMITWLDRKMTIALHDPLALYKELFPTKNIIVSEHHFSNLADSYSWEYTKCFSICIQL